MLKRFNIVFLSLKLNYEENEFIGFEDYNDAINSIEFQIKNPGFVVESHDFRKFPNLKKLKLSTQNLEPKFNFVKLEKLTELWMTSTFKIDKMLNSLKPKFKNKSFDKLRIDKKADQNTVKESLYSIL